MYLRHNVALMCTCVRVTTQVRERALAMFKSMDEDGSGAIDRDELVRGLQVCVRACACVCLSVCARACICGHACVRA